MPAGVVLDTSFLITLADSHRHNHAVARRYWIHFTENAIPIYLPTIVVSEFCLRQEIPVAILRSCVVLPFNWDDAKQAAALNFKRGIHHAQNRDSLKDDVKILGQAAVKESAYVITDDSSSFYEFGKMMENEGTGKFKTIKLGDGFDIAFFNGGQRELGLGADNQESEE
jgi:predicted nucleic acid-binding protein